MNNTYINPYERFLISNIDEEDEENDPSELFGYEEFDEDDEYEEEQAEPYYMDDMNNDEEYMLIDFANNVHNHNNISEFTAHEIENKYQKAISRLKHLIDKYSNSGTISPGVIMHATIFENVNDITNRLNNKLRYLINNPGIFSLAYLNELLDHVREYDFYYATEIITCLNLGNYKISRLRKSRSGNMICPITQDKIQGQRCVSSCCYNNFSKLELIRWILSKGNCPMCRSENIQVLTL